METRIFHAENIGEAGKLLSKGQLVAFPTETVYGLGAIASNEEAVKEVYQVKGRPSDNPLIVHVASSDIAELVASVPPVAQPLMQAFWPGPLTLIFEAKDHVFAPALSSGRGTVSLRMPDQPLTIRLIEETGFPIVGPSANTSGKPSPTTVEHVLHDLSGKIAGVVDGGATQIGVESTVLDLTDERGLVILRPGAISREMIEEVVDEKVWVGGDKVTADEEAPKAPGMKYVHYSPKQPVILVSGNDSDWSELIDELLIEGKKIALLASMETLESLANRGIKDVYSLGRKEEAREASKHLYAGLRYFDEADVDVILAEGYPKVGIGQAYMNRLEKAASSLYPKL
ncbi:L-threonylcarbamoyladenylate synthase [Jeotgalibaca caeni]|uniref:L-threonylcarbamoyladenylate synthase n=1 Tax=Jeotgalibaca caeni TaxID=3028623 RepID=UPI00237ED211|nr:L-threonylcarbamoyladenylate synthase [Jeotgalibaca caeni]MDE1548870.1 L-threonylcarbamoyladenylate synthase [Jeotgalibaca caeni]